MSKASRKCQAAIAAKNPALTQTVPATPVQETAPMTAKPQNVATNHAAVERCLVRIKLNPPISDVVLLKEFTVDEVMTARKAAGAPAPDVKPVHQTANEKEPTVNPTATAEKKPAAAPAKKPTAKPASATAKTAPKPEAKAPAKKPAPKPAGKTAPAKPATKEPAKKTTKPAAPAKTEENGDKLLNGKRLPILKALAFLKATSGTSGKTSDEIAEAAKLTAQDVKHFCYKDNDLAKAEYVVPVRLEGDRVLRYYITEKGRKALAAAK